MSARISAIPDGLSKLSSTLKLLGGGGVGSELESRGILDSDDGGCSGSIRWS